MFSLAQFHGQNWIVDPDCVSGEYFHLSFSLEILILILDFLMVLMKPVLSSQSLTFFNVLD